jgi:hypothetical protein
MAIIAKWSYLFPGSSPVDSGIVWRRIAPLTLLGIFLERIEYLQSGPPEISVISCHNRQIMTARRRGDIAVFDRHSLAGQLKSSLLVRPHMGHRDIETMDATMHRLDKPCQPCLQAVSRFPVFAPYPIGELRDHDSTRVTVVLLDLEPCDDSRVTLLLCRLTKNVSIQKPTHSFRRRDNSRRRRGRSSIGTGHSFRIVNQSPLGASLRKINVSSSGWNSASK